jgi:ATP-binding cassette subfamily B protein
MSSKKEKKSTKDTERFVRQIYFSKLKQHRIGYLTPLTFLLGNIIAVNIAPIIYSSFIKRAIDGGYSSWQQLVTPLSVLLALYSIRSILFSVADYVWSNVSTKVQGELIEEGHQLIAYQSKIFFADNFTGSLTNKINTFAGGFQGLLNEYSYNLLPAIITVVLIFAYVVSKSIVLVAPFLLTIVFYGLFVSLTRPRRKVLNKDRQKKATVFQGQLADSISSMEVVKSEGAEKRELSYLGPTLSNSLSSKVKAMSYGNVLSRITGLVSQVFTLLALAFSVVLFINSQIDIAIVLIMTSYAGSLVDKIGAISNFKINSQEIYNSSFEMAEIMMQEPEIQDPLNPTKLKITKGQIQFQNASFKYTNSSEELKEDEDPGSDSDMAGSKNKKELQHLFQNLNLTIQPGEKIGLVGPSGGGKSTLLKLILRFYDVDSGQVLIDDVNVKDVIQSKLRQQIAYVPQDPALFHRSIKENIGYSKPNAKNSEIQKAAKQAYVDEFIQTLPEGYETLVGERGVKLSGGQRQRVAIARAILKDAPILLLDEATSALDSESESYIQKSLEKLMKGRTTVVVAHRLSTIRKMDRIIVVDKGRVVDSGPHEQLLKTSPLYKKLWSHQSGGILQD